MNFSESATALPFVLAHNTHNRNHGKWIGERIEVIIIIFHIQNKGYTIKLWFVMSSLHFTRLRYEVLPSNTAFNR